MSPLKLNVLPCARVAALLLSAVIYLLPSSSVLAQGKIARSWPETGPRVLWTVEVGEGFAGPVISKGQIFLLDRRKNEQDVLRCLELETGREVWTFAYDAPGTLPYNGSRNMPALDEERIFMVGPFGHFHCLDRGTHQVLWAKHLVDDFKDPEIDRDTPPTNRVEKLERAQVPMWGMTQVPVLYKDTVVVAPQTQKTGLVAYEKATGNIRWRSDYIGRNWYSHVSPCLATLCGVDQIIMLAQPSDPEKAPDDAPPAIISGIDAATGRILWTTKTPRPHKIPVPQPLPIGNDRLFITGGYNLGCCMLQVACVAGKWETKLLFENKTAAGHIHSPVLHQDHIYFTSLKEQGGKSSGLVCLDLDGELAWQTGPGLQFDNGAFLIADGLAFAIQGKSGLLHLFELTPSSAKLLAKAPVLTAKDGKVWGPMALSSGKLLVRDQHQLKCLQVAE